MKKKLSIFTILLTLAFAAAACNKPATPAPAGDNMQQQDAMPKTDDTMQNSGDSMPSGDAMPYDAGDSMSK